MQVDEAVDRDEGQRALAVLEVHPGQVELRLLGPAAERIARLQPFEQLDRLAQLPEAIEFALRLRI